MQAKALRVAAYFLIGHFFIVTGLELLGKTPDFFRIVITLGLLIASVGSLFIPRKLGWAMVVAYAWYALTPFLIATWAIFAAPNLPSAARITTSIVLLLINSPLIVALVLVFKPASFASFRNPLSGDADKPAGASGSRRLALGAAAAIAVLAVAAILSVDAYRTTAGSQWMTAAQYQREFDTRARKGFYPHEVEGECRTDGEKFRADWKAIPSDATFLTHHGMTMQDYDLRNQEYSSKGYSLGSMKHFKDCSGIERYQATWLKR